MRSTAKLLFAIIATLVFILVLMLGIALLPLLKLSWDMERQEANAAESQAVVAVGPDGSALLSDGQRLHGEIVDYLEQEHHGSFSYNIFINQDRAVLEMKVFFLEQELDESQLLPLWEKLSFLHPDFVESGWRLEVNTLGQQQDGEVQIRGVNGDHWEELSRVLDQQLLPGTDFALNLDTNTAEVFWSETEVGECASDAAAQRGRFFGLAVDRAQGLLAGLGWDAPGSPGMVISAHGCERKLNLLAELVDEQRAEKLAALPGVLAAAGEDISFTRLWIVADHLPPEGAKWTDGRGELILGGVAPDGSALAEETSRLIIPSLQEQWPHGTLKLNGKHRETEQPIPR
ncbi:hypothetical protein COCCU_02340 [Corynebacterium occultum]|uniref:Uncharacterized protein n=1 Tax=Corynebacterium occultum TaxID=2675219 RepID=A0A6B8VLS1_9CORY|nr:hypothetical protein [Corynebacterium occultum]QGU06422.1 hypothetical protein COCCU_02340 [Corynebacterium occultum]